jgi:hypothetical protein
MTGLLGMIAVAVAVLMAAVALALAGSVGATAVTALAATLLLTALGVYVRTARRRKFLVWQKFSTACGCEAAIGVLDLGCGRGADSRRAPTAWTCRDRAEEMAPGR